MRVLLIEPNRLQAQQYTRFLTSKGHRVQWREDAQSAVLAADKAGVDVVIIELMLAGHSGIEFLYEFRSYGDWLHVPAIILSGISKSVAGVADATLRELGVSAYLYKPETSLQLLSQTLNRLPALKR